MLGIEQIRSQHNANKDDEYVFCRLIDPARAEPVAVAKHGAPWSWGWRWKSSSG